jgi:hypothetical protein
MDIAVPPPFRAADYVVRHASEPWELAGAAALRRAVFCDEQAIFADDDRDEIDRDATPIVAISTMGIAPRRRRLAPPGRHAGAGADPAGRLDCPCSRLLPLSGPCPESE